jgi:cytochrome b subunit of formate dehydrogenase
MWTKAGLIQRREAISELWHAVTPLHYVPMRCVHILQTFWVTETRTLSEADRTGLLVRGNLRDERTKIFAHVQEKVRPAASGVHFSHGMPFKMTWACALTGSGQVVRWCILLLTPVLRLPSCLVGSTRC